MSTFWAVYDGWNECTGEGFDLEKLKATTLEEARVEALNIHPVLELNGLYLIEGARHDIDLETAKAETKAKIKAHEDDVQRRRDLGELARLKAMYEPGGTEPSEPPKG